MINKRWSATFTVLATISMGSIVAKSALTANDVLTVDVFIKEAKNNKLLIGKGVNDAPLDDIEKHMLGKAEQYATSTASGKNIRSADDFKGHTLIVGGGRKIGKAYKNDVGGVTDLSKEYEEIEDIKKGTSKFAMSPDGTVIKLDTEEKGASVIKQNEQKIQNILDEYYTVNYDENTEPDLVASITSKKNMSKIPDSKFELVIFENVDSPVWFNSNIFSILERITKPGGIIRIEGALHPRLLVVAFAKTKWADQVNLQLGYIMDRIKIYGEQEERFTLTFVNEK